MPIPREEQESVQTCGYGQETMTFATTNPAHARHMQRLGVKPDRVSHIDREPVAWTFVCPAAWFALPRPKRKVSDSERQARSERAKTQLRKQKGAHHTEPPKSGLILAHTANS